MDIEYALKQGWIVERPDGTYGLGDEDNNPLLEHYVNAVDDILWGLFEKGFVYPSIGGDDEVLWNLTEKGKRYAKG